MSVATLTPAEGLLDHAHRQLTIHSALARRRGGAIAVHDDGRSLFIPDSEQAFHCDRGLVNRPIGRGWRFEQPVHNDLTDTDLADLVIADDPAPVGHMPFGGRWESMRAHVYALLRADEAYLPVDPCDDARYLSLIGTRIAHEPKFLMAGFVAPELRVIGGSPVLRLNDPGHTVVRRDDLSDLPYIGVVARRI